MATYSSYIIQFHCIEEPNQEEFMGLLKDKPHLLALLDKKRVVLKGRGY